MFGRFSRGWSIVRQSWSVLRQDKELVLFPVLSTVSCVLVLASFVAPFLVVPELGRQVLEGFDEERQVPVRNQVLGYSLLFTFYFVNYFVIVFFNTALVSCAIIRFAGGSPTLADGFRAACLRLPQIFGWAFLAATVGFVLQIIESRSEWVGKMVVRVIGVAWTAAAYLVVPALAVERLGPIQAMRRSVSLLRRSWGEGIAGNLSLGGISFVLSLPGILLMVGGGVAGAVAQSPWLAALLVGCGLLYLLCISVVISTLKQIFLAGLYIFAAEQRVPEGFAEDSFRDSFRPR